MLEEARQASYSDTTGMMYAAARHVYRGGAGGVCCRGWAECTWPGSLHAGDRKKRVVGVSSVGE